MSQTFITGVRFDRGRPALVAIVAIALFFGTSSEPMGRFWQLHLLKTTGRLPASTSLHWTPWIPSSGGGSSAPRQCCLVSAL